MQHIFSARWKKFYFSIHVYLILSVYIPCGPSNSLMVCVVNVLADMVGSWRLDFIYLHSEFLHILSSHWHTFIAWGRIWGWLKSVATPPSCAPSSVHILSSYPQQTQSRNWSGIVWDLQFGRDMHGGFTGSYRERWSKGENITALVHACIHQCSFSDRNGTYIKIWLFTCMHCKSGHLIMVSEANYPARACAKGLSNQFFLSVCPSVRPSVRPSGEKF